MPTLTDAEVDQIYAANKGDPAAVNRAIAARLTGSEGFFGPSGSSYGDGAFDPMTVAEGYRRAKEQRDHTARNFMSREDFLKKYGPVFVADDKGGNAASEVAGQNVAEYYDKYLAPGAKGTQSIRGGEYGQDMVEVPIDWSMGKYTDAHPYFDAWDNVNPHPESQRGNGWDEAWKTVGRPIATAAAMYFGVGALGSALGAGGTAGTAAGTAAGAGSASGLAGMIGMDAGMGATALNAGALNTGMSLARGQSLSDSLKNGVIGAAMSPLSTLASNATTSALADRGLGAGWTKAIGTIAGNTANGAARGALTGDVSSGLRDGFVNGLASAGGSYVGGAVEGETGSPIAGRIASSLTKTGIRGGDLASTLVGGATNEVIDKITDNIDGFKDLSVDDRRVINGIIADAMRGKSITPNLINNVLKGASKKTAELKKRDGKVRVSSNQTHGW